MTAEVNINVTGEMDAAPYPTPKTKFTDFLQFPPNLPDPHQFYAHQKQNVRPWLQFIQSSNFKTPTITNLPRLSKRIMKNIEYFQSNYLFVFIGLFIYCLITSPLILLVLSAQFYIGYKLNQRHKIKKFHLAGKELTLAQVYGLLCLASLPIHYLVGVHGALFWVVAVSFFLIVLHASFYNIDAVLKPGDSDVEFLMEEV